MQNQINLKSVRNYVVKCKWCVDFIAKTEAGVWQKFYLTIIDVNNLKTQDVQLQIYLQGISVT